MFQHMIDTMKLQAEKKQSVTFTPSDEALNVFKALHGDLVISMGKTPELMCHFLRHHLVKSLDFSFSGYPRNIQEIIVMTGNGEPVTCALENGAIVSVDGIVFNPTTGQLDGVLVPRSLRNGGLTRDQLIRNLCIATHHTPVMVEELITHFEVPSSRISDQYLESISVKFAFPIGLLEAIRHALVTIAAFSSKSSALLHPKPPK